MAVENNWSWRYLDAEGAEVTEPASETFANQSDAESWLGENWRELAEAGAAQVVLLDGERVEYEMALAAE